MFLPPRSLQTAFRKFTHPTSQLTNWGLHNSQTLHQLCMSEPPIDSHSPTYITCNDEQQDRSPQAAPYSSSPLFMNHSNEEIQTRDSLPIHLTDCCKEPHRKKDRWLNFSFLCLSGLTAFQASPSAPPPTWHSTVHTIPCRTHCEHTKGIFLGMVRVMHPGTANLPHTKVPQHILDLRYLQWRWLGFFFKCFLKQLAEGKPHLQNKTT